MLDILGALTVFRAALVVLAGLGNVVQISQHQTARVQFGSGVVDHVNLDDLAFLVVVFLGGVHGIVVLTHREGHHLLRHAADFLGAGQAGLNAAMPQEVGDLVADKGLALVAGQAKLALLCHVGFLLSLLGRLLILRWSAEPGPIAPAYARLLPGSSCPGCGPSSCLPGFFAPVRTRC